MDLLGAKDIIAKSLGSSNNLNVAQATLLALQKLRTKPEEVAPKSVEAKAEEKKAEVIA